MSKRIKAETYTDQTYYGNLTAETDATGVTFSMEWDSDFKEDFIQFYEESGDGALYDLFGGLIGNGWQWVSGDEKGLTDADVIEDPEGNVYWDEDYQVTSPVEELIEKGVTRFRRADDEAYEKQGAKEDMWYGVAGNNLPRNVYDYLKEIVGDDLNEDTKFTLDFTSGDTIGFFIEYPTGSGDYQDVYGISPRDPIYKDIFSGTPPSKRGRKKAQNAQELGYYDPENPDHEWNGYHVGDRVRIIADISDQFLDGDKEVVDFKGSTGYISGFYPDPADIEEFGPLEINLTRGPGKDIMKNFREDEVEVYKKARPEQEWADKRSKDWEEHMVDVREGWEEDGIRQSRKQGYKIAISDPSIQESEEGKPFTEEYYDALGWRGHLQDTYESLEEFISYDEIYGISARLGFDTAEEAWDENPYTEGSTNPSDLKTLEEPAKYHRARMAILKFAKEAKEEKEMTGSLEKWKEDFIKDLLDYIGKHLKDKKDLKEITEMLEAVLDFEEKNDKVPKAPKIDKVPPAPPMDKVPDAPEDLENALDM